MYALMKALWDDESGQALVEYGLVVGLIAVALIAVVMVFRDQLSGLFGRMGDQIGTADAAAS